MKKKQKVVASIEARMTSSRLPGKVLMPAVGEISMLQFMIERIRLAKNIDEILVATTINDTDKPIVDLCEKIGIRYFRGSEEDVLQRVLDAHKSVDSDIIVELTGDCQLIDPTMIDESIDFYQNNNYDYVSNCHVRSYPIGLDIQVFATSVLEDIAAKTSLQEEREHVSLYIYKSGEYSLKAIVAEGDLFWPELRITLDDKGDYKLLKAICEYFYPKKGFDFSATEVLKYLRENLHLLELIKDVRVKENIYEKTAERKD